MEGGKILECSTEESLGIQEAVRMNSAVRNWRDPTYHRKVKKAHISQKMKLWSWQEGVRGEISTYEDMDNKTILREGSLLHLCF